MKMRVNSVSASGMRQLVAFSVALFCAVSASGEVEKGANLLVNGALEADQSELPPFWSYPESTDAIRWDAQGGPGSKPCLVFNGGRVAGEISVRQWGLQLSSNGTYRISAWIRTRNVSGKLGGFVVANSGWRSASGVGAPDTKGEWRYFENTIKCFPSSGLYMAILYAGKFSGEIAYADLRLEAVDDVALRETKPPAVADAQNRVRLVPFAPILAKIPADDRRITFRFYGRLPNGVTPSGCEARFSFDGVSGGEVRAPISDGRAVCRLPAGAKEGLLTARVVARADGAELSSEVFRYRVVPPVTVSAKGHRRLNNFATEILAARLDGSAGARAFDFCAPRDGWVFAAVDTEERTGLSVSIDGVPVIDAATPRLETFRRLKAGPHVLAVSGASAGTVIVRSIGEILNYCPASSLVRENPPYDLAFQERYVFPAVTTLNGGGLGADSRRALRARGYLYLSNFITGGLKSPEDLLSRISKCASLRANAPDIDGVTCDEQFFMTPKALDDYAQGLWRHEVEGGTDKLVYSWVVGKPSIYAIDPSFMSAARNVSRGEGRVALEVYCRSKPDEATARRYLQSYLVDSAKAFRAWDPHSIASLLMVLGNFNQVPLICLATHPESDYKYYLDMQLNLLANDPAFDGIAGTGYWGSYYADEEMLRWSFALMRHYVVEGRTEMLSSKHRFTFSPGHILNGDFRESMDGWRTSGVVRRENVPGLPTSEGRWGGSGVGDSCAVLVRGEGDSGVAKIAQTAKGLVPGRKYVLQAVFFDVADFKLKKIAPRKIALEMSIASGGVVDADRSWRHVDRRNPEKKNFPRVNVRHIVFTATATEAEIVFTNEGAVAGETLGVNFVYLNPYFP